MRVLYMYEYIVTIILGLDRRFHVWRSVERGFYNFIVGSMKCANA